MSFYRYAIAYPQENAPEKYLRSLTPPTSEMKQYPYFSYRYYTSEKDDFPDCHVISLGYEVSWPNKSHGPRSVNRFILHYVIRGKGYFNGQPVEKGQMFFTHPYDEHVIIVDEDDPMEFYYIGIAGPGIENIMKNAGFLSVPQIQDCPFIDQIPEFFHDPLFELHPDSDTDYYLMSVFLRLMALHKNHNFKKPNTPNEDAFFYYKQALIFIEEYLLDGITPKDVAEYLHLSPSYVRAIFAKYCKYSLRELLIRKRVECAANHLSFNRFSVAQAANLIGYEDYTQFSKIFKKYTGMSPQTYKKSLQNISVLQKNVKVFPSKNETYGINS